MIKLNDILSSRHLRTLVSEDVLREEIRSVHIPQLDNLERKQILFNSSQKVPCRSIQSASREKVVGLGTGMRDAPCSRAGRREGWRSSGSGSSGTPQPTP